MTTEIPNCGICGLPCVKFKGLRNGNPLFKTVDHIVPLSRGGDDLDHNRQPAHYYCNQAKGNKALDAALTARCRSMIYFLLMRDHRSSNEILRLTRETVGALAAPPELILPAQSATKPTVNVNPNRRTHFKRSDRPRKARSARLKGMLHEKRKREKRVLA